MDSAVGTEKTIQEFFLNVKDCVRSSVPYPKWNEEDLKLQRLLKRTSTYLSGIEEIEPSGRVELESEK